MSEYQTLPGINIQWPWSRLLASGEKTVETRSYQLPEKYIGQPLALIETPGPNGLKVAGIHKAEIIGIIIFQNSFRYHSKQEWIADLDRHLVKENDPLFGFKNLKPKWGWSVAKVFPFDAPTEAPLRKGIVFTSHCQVEIVRMGSWESGH